MSVSAQIDYNERDRITKLIGIDALETLEALGYTVVRREMVDQLRASYANTLQKFYDADDDLRRIKAAMHAVLAGQVITWAEEADGQQR